jgi:hypothetical protein
MLLAQKSYAEGALALNLYCSKLVDEERAAHATGDDNAQARATLLLDILTPIAKSWPSQWCLEGNSLAIQVHGGYGYTREYNVEQFYRDNRLNPIHEGTHGIQGLDLLGRKVTMKNGAALRTLDETMKATIFRAVEISGSGVQDFGYALNMALSRLMSVTRDMWAAGDPGLTLANASLYLEAFGHVVMAWVWLEQALAAHEALARCDDSSGQSFYRGKLAAARYFFRWELPRVFAQFDLLHSLDRSTLDMQDAWF